MTQPNPYNELIADAHQVAAILGIPLDVVLNLPPDVVLRNLNAMRSRAGVSTPVDLGQSAAVRSWIERALPNVTRDNGRTPETASNV